MHERIAKIIDVIGLKKIEFAKRLGISAPFASELCTGAKKPSDRTIADICREFNVSEDWLRTGKGEMFSATPETLAEKLSREYGLDALGCQIMAAYLKLDEQDRLAVGRLIQNIIDERTIPSPVAKIPTKLPQKMTDEELHAELDRQLAEEKKQAESVSASGRGGSSTAIG